MVVERSYAGVIDDGVQLVDVVLGDIDGLIDGTVQVVERDLQARLLLAHHVDGEAVRGEDLLVGDGLLGVHGLDRELAGVGGCGLVAVGGGHVVDGDVVGAHAGVGEGDLDGGAGLQLVAGGVAEGDVVGLDGGELRAVGLGRVGDGLGHGVVLDGPGLERGALGQRAGRGLHLDGCAVGQGGGQGLRGGGVGCRGVCRGLRLGLRLCRGLCRGAGVRRQGGRLRLVRARDAHAAQRGRHGQRHHENREQPKQPPGRA